jgi:hypothetical protein
VKLLVSVVSADEARAALHGGADVIDVKDPGAGPLGAPSPAVVAGVVAAVDGAAPVSVALGDLPDAAAPPAVDFVKAGLRVRDIDSAVALLRAIDHPAVIAAAYADAAALDPPALPPAALPEVVARAGIAGALVDTYVKDGRGLYAWLSPAALAALIAETPGTFAVAGQLGLDELDRVAADLVGVRSAVCRSGRTGVLDAELVAAAAARAHSASGRRTVTPTPVRRTASGR